MKPIFKTVAVIGKTAHHNMTLNVDDIAKPLLKLANCITECGCELLFEKNTWRATEELHHFPSATLEEIGHKADIALVLGGDGTMLGVGRQLSAHNVPLIGINYGRLGFMTDLQLKDIPQVLPEILSGNFKTEQRLLLEAWIEYKNQIIYRAQALNDVVIRSGCASMIELSAEVDGRFMYRQRSDGLIVSTPTGSTAYALSANGPILHPKLEGIVLVPIAPHMLSNRPIVLPADSQVVLSLVGGKEVSVNFDMQVFTELQQGHRVFIQRSPHVVTFLHPQEHSYYDTLRKKLHWNI